MQISRHWRLNANRYRLEGYRYPNGEVSMQYRPYVQNRPSQEQQNGTKPEGQQEGARISRERGY